MFPSKAVELVPLSLPSGSILFECSIFELFGHLFCLLSYNMTIWPRSRVLAIMDNTQRKCDLVTRRYEREANGCGGFGD
jgi:hypothetical protein